jgi:long-chain acyl-CoA synthetase
MTGSRWKAVLPKRLPRSSGNSTASMANSYRNATSSPVADVDRQDAMLIDAPVFEPKSPLGVPGLGSFEALSEIVARQADVNPARQALMCNGERLCWGDLVERIERVAGALNSLGVGRGDNVVLLSPVSIAAVIGFFGILRAGGCVVPLPTTANGDQLEGMARDADAKAILVAESMKTQAELFAARIPTVLPGGFRILDVLDSIDSSSAVAVGVRPDDPFNIIYTSGTTGSPRGIVYDHATRWFQFAQNRAAGIDESSICIISTPLYSNTTLAGGLLQTLAAGGSLVLMRKFDAGEFLQLCQSERVTHATVVPVQCQRVLAYPELDDYDLSRLRLRITAAPLTLDLKRQLARRFPGRVVETYGYSELGAGCVLDLTGDADKLHTVGRPRQDVELKIIDDQGRAVSAGAVGEIVGRACTMMRGYYKQPELTRQLLWFDSSGRAFLRSGDVGKMDDQGFLSLLDRKKDMIISGGFNIYPADLESVIAGHADVYEVAVIGVPSEQWGESPLALVVLHAGSSATEAEIREWANARLGKFQRVAAVEVRDRLPRSSVGKVLKRELRAAYWPASGRHV